MNHVPRCDRFYELEPMQISDAVEEAFPIPEQYRRYVQLHLVDEACIQEVLRGLRST